MPLRIGKGGYKDVEPGRYPSVIFSVKSRKTRFGSALLVEVELIDEDHSGVHVDGMFPPSCTEKNKTGRLVRHAGVDMPGEDGIDAEELVGKHVDVQVGRRNGTQYTFACIKDTYPPMQPGQDRRAAK